MFFTKVNKIKEEIKKEIKSVIGNTTPDEELAFLNSPEQIKEQEQRYDAFFKRSINETTANTPLNHALGAISYRFNQLKELIKYDKDDDNIVTNANAYLAQLFTELFNLDSANALKKDFGKDYLSTFTFADMQNQPIRFGKDAEGYNFLAMQFAINSTADGTNYYYEPFILFLQQTNTPKKTPQFKIFTTDVVNAIPSTIMQTHLIAERLNSAIIYCGMEYGNERGFSKEYCENMVDWLYRLFNGENCGIIDTHLPRRGLATDFKEYPKFLPDGNSAVQLFESATTEFTVPDHYKNYRNSKTLSTHYDDAMKFYTNNNPRSVNEQHSSPFSGGPK